jgi:exo-1,4-beta-D-glucosaminidase
VFGGDCTDSWQHWPYWKAEQFAVSADSLRWQLRRLRVHPSVLVFLYSSDELPPVDVEQNYLSVFAEIAWPAERLAAASAAHSTLSGPTGVKMVRSHTELTRSSSR